MMDMEEVNRLDGIGLKWMGPAGIAVFLLGLPVYVMADTIFKSAIVRDNGNTLFERKNVKKFMNLINEAVKKKEPEPGLGFADFTQETENGTCWFKAQKKERITMSSGDGLRLIAYYLPAPKESNKIMILMHGYRNDGFGDFAGLVKFYHEMGYHLLVPHQRSHGESEGNYICFGAKERYDLKQWTDYMAKRFGEKYSIFLSGISMGGATVLAAAGLELPRQVKGIIADCAFTSPWNIFTYIMEEKYHLPKIPFLYVTDWICKKRAGFSLKEYSTISCMKSNKIPVLFIHGGKDRFVPFKMSYENYEACSAPKEILIIGQAAHGASNLAEPDAYRNAVIEFMRKWESGGRKL